MGTRDCQGMNARFPSLQRAVLIVLLSYDSSSVLLERSTQAAAWMPIQLDVPRSSWYAETVWQWQRHHEILRGAQRGPVVGQLSMDTTVGCQALRTMYQLVILKLAHPTDTGRCYPSARWWPVEGLDRDTASCSPRSWGLSMRG